MREKDSKLGEPQAAEDVPEIIRTAVTESSLSRKNRRNLRRAMLQYVQQLRETAEKHARLRGKMEPYL